MGPITRDMARLHDEIVAMREQRHDLMANVKQASDDRKEAVNDMAEGFRSARMEMKAQMAASHERFIGDLQHHVAALCNGVAGDLASARRAFQGGRG